MFPLTVFISWLLLFSGSVLLITGFANVFYVGYFLRSRFDLFPVELIYSPFLVLLGAAFLSSALEMRRFSYLDVVYAEFKQKTQNEKYLDSVKKGTALFLCLFVLPISINGQGGHRLRFLIENNFFYAIGNLILLLLFSFGSFALSVAALIYLKKNHRSGK